MRIIINIFLVSIFTSCSFLFAQKYETNLGSLKNIEGISEYKVVFEYDSLLKIPNYDSEASFITFQINKRERKIKGSGRIFKEQWFGNRKNIYEPEFIKEFNNFKLKKRKINIGKENPNANHTMVITTSFIYPGYDATVWGEDTKLEVTITIYKNDSKDNILYATKIVKIHGRPSSDEFERVKTAYGELGKATSKHFCRKT